MDDINEFTPDKRLCKIQSILELQLWWYDSDALSNTMSACCISAKFVGIDINWNYFVLPAINCEPALTREIILYLNTSHTHIHAHRQTDRHTHGRTPPRTHIYIYIYIYNRHIWIFSFHGCAHGVWLYLTHSSTRTIAEVCLKSHQTLCLLGVNYIHIHIFFFFMYV